MKDFMHIVLGIGVCVILLIVGDILGTTAHGKNNALLFECEQTLPRDQNCVLIAVPNIEKEKNLVR